MYLHWFLIFLPVTFGTGVSQIQTNDLKAINFAKEIRGHKLIGSVIKEVEVESEYACQLQCVCDSRCLSYNFGPTDDKKRFKCQLSDSDRFSGVGNFTQDEEFTYRGLQVLQNCGFL